MFNLFRSMPSYRSDIYNQTIRVENILRRFLTSTMVGAAGYTILLLINRSHTSLNYALFAFFASACFLFLFGKVATYIISSSWILVLWLLAAFIVWSDTGITSVGYSGFIILIVASVLLLGRRVSLCIIAITLLYGLALVFFNSRFENTISTEQALHRWIINCIHFGIVYWLCDYILQTMQLMFVSLEHQLSEREQESALLNSMMNTSVAAITVLDPQGSIVFANTKAEDILGLKPNDITNRHYNSPEWHHQSLDGSEWRNEQQPFTIVMRTKQPVYDIRHAIIWPNGLCKYLSINGDPILDENDDIQLLVFAVIDITQSYNTQEDLRESEKRYRLISEVITNVAFAYAVEGQTITCQWITEAFEKMTGYAPEMVDTLYDWQAYIHPDDIKIFTDMINGVMACTPQNVELRFKISQGNDIWLRMFLQPDACDDTGIVLNIYGAAQDVTQLKQLQLQLFQSQKMEAVGRLAGGIAHDFNNILTVILGHSSFALEVESLPSEVYDDMHQITLAAERAAMLTRQLLAFSRQEIVQPQVINVNEVLKSIGSMLRRLIGEDIELIMLYEPDLDYIYIDSGQLQQVILNLVVNARDAMPAGGSISIQTRNTMYAPESEDLALPYVQLKVCDTGVGIDESTRTQMFEPFFTTKDSSKGTGLGLSIVDGIVSQQSGFVLVDSYPDVGTVFTILLPASQKRESLNPADPVALVTHNADAQVLLVEDEEMVRVLLKRMLDHPSRTLFTASDGDSALHILPQLDDKLDLLITDIVLPNGMNGVELARFYQQLFPNLKVLFLSGYIDPEIIDSDFFSSSPLIAYMQKPFEMNELLAKVELLLSLH